MRIDEPGKFLLLAIALVGGFAMAILGTFQHDNGSQLAGMGTVGVVVGYLTGNGRLAARGKSPAPVLGPRRPQAEPEPDAQVDEL